VARQRAAGRLETACRACNGHGVVPSRWAFTSGTIQYSLEKCRACGGTGRREAVVRSLGFQIFAIKRPRRR
jgi:DnaJ-class molecular chaperone